jgi:hypothetical protein
MKSTLFAKGGRGKIAPYETTHARIPVEIKDYVKFISDGFKQSLENGTVGDFLLLLGSAEKISTQNVMSNSFDELEQLQRKISEMRKTIEELVAENKELAAKISRLERQNG